MTLHLISLMSLEPQTSQIFRRHRIEVQREIHRGRRVRERADGDPVDARLGDHAHRVEVHSPRRLGHSASSDQLHRVAQLMQLHVVEQDDVRARVDRRAT